MSDKDEPDFIITIGGEDVTKLVESWELHEDDNAISSIKVHLVNPDMLLSGAFQADQEITLMFGTVNDMSNNVTGMKIKGITEYYALNGCRIELLGQDILADIDNKSIKGMMKEGTSVTDSIKNAVEGACPGSTCKVDLKSPEKGKVRFSAPASSLYSFITRSAAMCHVESGAEPGGSTLFKQMEADIKGGAIGAKVTSGTYTTASNKFIWSGKKPPEVGKDTGGRGEKSGGGDKKKDNSKNATYDYATHSKQNHVDNNRGENATNKTIQSAVRGELKMVWYPSLRAKKCISVGNVGSEASGDWYVSKAIHTWSVQHGGTSSAHLMRNDPQDEQDSKDKPGKGAVQQATNPAGA